MAKSPVFKLVYATFTTGCQPSSVAVAVSSSSKRLNASSYFVVFDANGGDMQSWLRARVRKGVRNKARRVYCSVTGAVCRQ